MIRKRSSAAAHPAGSEAKRRAPKDPPRTGRRTKADAKAPHRSAQRPAPALPGRGAPAPGSERARVAAIRRTLRRLYPQVRTALAFASPYQLLVATVLSAQCTDERVNRVTPGFFARFPDAATLARGPRADIEEIIRPTGFFRMKAKSLQETAAGLAERHQGRVPADLDALVALPGIGRKTANVILGNAFGIPGITVDTHVRRVSLRLALTREDHPEKIEIDLMRQVPRREWSDFSLRLIEHGRRICVARKPRCPACALLPHCPAGAALTGNGAVRR